MDDLPEEKLAKQSSGIQFDGKAASRALGVHWDLETDCFVYKVNVSIDQTKPCIKGIILKKIATIYDLFPNTNHTCCKTVHARVMERSS